MDFSELTPHAQSFFKGDLYCGAIGMNNLLMPLCDRSRRAEPLTACHVLFTGPHKSNYPDKPFTMSLTDQWTARLSALAWRRFNGPIHMITDREGSAYIRSIGLDRFYDSIQDDLWDPYGLNQKKFWASGKLLALDRMCTPCVIIDMDLIVWKPLELKDEPLIVAHKETINTEFYPGKDFFLMSPRYQFPSDWNFAAEPFNTSLLYINDANLKTEYLKEAFKFMQYERGTPDHGTVCMIFAEQRLLAICADKLKIHAKHLLDLNTLPDTGGLITHTWNAKPILRMEKELLTYYIQCCQTLCSRLEQELSQ